MVVQLASVSGVGKWWFRWLAYQASANGEPRIVDQFVVGMFGEFVSRQVCGRRPPVSFFDKTSVATKIARFHRCTAAASRSLRRRSSRGQFACHALDSSAQRASSCRRRDWEELGTAAPRRRGCSHGPRDVSFRFEHFRKIIYFSKAW